MFHSGQAQPIGHRRPGLWPRLFGVVAGAVLLLSACGPAATNDDDRRFANETEPPRATLAPQGSPVASRPGDLLPPVAATPDLGRLLSPPATASTAFFLLDGRLLIARIDGAIQEVLLPGPVSALSISSAGDVAAVLVRSNSDAGTPAASPEQPTTPDPAASAGGTGLDVSAVVIGADGAVIRTIDDLRTTLEGRPDIIEAMSGESSVATVAIGPTPGDLLVAFSDGLLVRFPAEGEAAIVPGSGNLADVVTVVWSPDGGALAIVAAGEDGGIPALYYTALREDGIDPVRVAPALGRTTGGVAWLPDSRGLVFIDASGPVSAETLRAGRDLFVTPLRSDRRTLVAAAGIIGPSAGVVDFVVSPDGASVAYTLYRAEGNDARFNSLWVGGIDGRSPVQLSLPDGGGVQGLAWTVAGLLVLTSPAADGAPAALLVGPDGVARPATDQVSTPAA